MTLAVFLDLLVVVLLLAAIVVAVILNKRLAAFRAAKAEFEQVIERFNTAAARAEAGVNALKLTGEATGGALQHATARAQALRDELVFLTERAEPMVDRLAATHRANTTVSRPAAAPAKPAAAAPKAAPKAETAPAMPIPSAEADLLKTLSSLR
jgi:hypothetical protein